LQRRARLEPFEAKYSEDDAMQIITLSLLESAGAYPCKAGERNAVFYRYGFP
jgi:hypothetical protein